MVCMLIFERLNRQNNMKFGASPTLSGYQKGSRGWGAAQHAAHMQHEVQDALNLLPSQERSWRKRGPDKHAEVDEQEKAGTSNLPISLHSRACVC